MLRLSRDKRDGQVEQQTRPVEARDLDDGVAVRQRVVDGRHPAARAKVFGRAPALALRGDQIVSRRISPRKRLLDREGDAAGAAQFVLVALEGARDEMVSSAMPSVVVKICASTILAAGGGAGARR